MSGGATLGNKADEAKFKQIGSRPIRHDGLDKVTGRARFGADYALPGLLQGVFVRSPHAHARILSIDTSKAKPIRGKRKLYKRRKYPPPRQFPSNRSTNSPFSIRSMLKLTSVRGAILNRPCGW